MSKTQWNIMTHLGDSVFKYGKLLIWIVYLYFCYLLFLITIQYIPYNTDVAFLRIKQDAISNKHYVAAFFTHVYSSIFLMFFGALQFSDFLRRKYVKLHRSSGKIYFYILLFISAPSGLIMAFYANGGFLAQISFIVLSILWMLFTFFSFFFIIKGNVKKHQKFAIRSFALTLSAISLRLFKYLMVIFFEPFPMDAYRIAAWSGWIFNLIIAEIIIFIKFREVNNT